MIKQNLFSFLPDAASVRRSIPRNIGLTGLTQLLRFILQVASTIMLARLLSPEDFGLVAMAAIVTNFIAIFKDLGLGQAMVQSEVLDKSQASSLFWLSIATGIVLFVIVILLTPAIASFFEEPRLRAITPWLGFGLILTAPALTHQSLLQRNLRFASIARAELLANLFGLCCGVLLALNGYRYWSIVWMSLLTAATTSLLFWNQTRWVPSRLGSAPGMAGLFRFGRNLSGFNLINYFARNADNLLIGKFVGSDALGQYSRAYQMMMLPIQQINGPISAALIPSLSRLQKEPEAYAEEYLKWFGYIAWLTAIPIALLFHFGEAMILLLLGDQWTVAAEIFKWLALAMVFQPLANVTGVVFISLGLTGRMFRWGCFSSLVIVMSFLIGIKYGAVGVAIAYAVAVNGLIPLLLIFHCQKTPIDPYVLLRRIRLPCGIALCILSLGLLSS